MAKIEAKISVGKMFSGQRSYGWSCWLIMGGATSGPLYAPRAHIWANRATAERWAAKFSAALGGIRVEVDDE